jgi:predicted P-loop ATPase
MTLAPIPISKAKKRPKLEATELIIWLALRNEPDLHRGDLFKLDTFSGQTLIMHPIPIPSVAPPSNWAPRDTTDVDIGHLLVWLQANNFVKASITRVGHAIDMEADRNQFSAARKAIEDLPAWDGVQRMHRFWMDVCGAQAWHEGMRDEEVITKGRYLEMTARCFFISIIARIMRPGCKADFSPVLEGPQGSRKSTLLRIIALDRDDWFSDCMPRDLGNKDARSHLAGKLIVELAEMHQMKATQVDTLKGFLTVESDKFRPSYGRRDVTLKRQCVFVGTTNASNYFRDETGNRRFWPIACGDINLDLARQTMPQIYAEAYAEYQQGEQWWLPPDVEELAEAEQDLRIADDPWEEGVREAVIQANSTARLNGEAFFFVTAVDGLKKVEEARDRWDFAKQYRVALILKKLGGKNMRLPRRGNSQKRGFRFITTEKWLIDPAQQSQVVSGFDL